MFLEEARANAGATTGSTEATSSPRAQDVKVALPSMGGELLRQFRQEREEVEQLFDRLISKLEEVRLKDYAQQEQFIDRVIRLEQEAALSGLPKAPEYTVQKPAMPAGNPPPDSQLPGQLNSVHGSARGSIKSIQFESEHHSEYHQSDHQSIKFQSELQSAHTSHRGSAASLPPPSVVSQPPPPVEEAWALEPSPLKRQSTIRSKRWTVPDRNFEDGAEIEATASGTMPSSPTSPKRATVGSASSEKAKETSESRSLGNKYRRSRSALVDKAQLTAPEEVEEAEEPREKNLGFLSFAGGRGTRTLSALPTTPSTRGQDTEEKEEEGGLAKLYGEIYARGRNKSRLVLADMEERVPWWVKYTVGHSMFSVVSMSVILANAIFTGVHTQLTLEWELYGEDAGQKAACYIIELFFCGFFTVEILLRFAAGPKSFVFGSDRQNPRWNLFDSILVVTCLADIILQQVEAQQSFNYIRILRMLRLARLVRLIRVMRFFRSLRLMVYSIIHSMVSLLWVLLVLLTTMYVFSIFFMHSVMEHFKANIPSVENKNMVDSFGTVYSAMISLFKAISGGKDWHELYVPLAETGSLTGGTFIFYIFFVVFGVLNVVTGAFVDSMRLVSEKDHDTVVDAEMKKVDTFRKDVTKMFLDADMDASGTLSWDEFEQHLQDERVGAFFRSLQIDTSQARALFLLLDIEESDEVPIEKFVQGCMRMRGDAKSIDVNMLLYETEKMLCKITNFCEFAEDKFELIERELDRIDNYLGIQVTPRLGRRAGVFEGAQVTKPLVYTGNHVTNNVCTKEGDEAVEKFHQIRRYSRDLGDKKPIQERNERRGSAASAGSSEVPGSEDLRLVSPPCEKETIKASEASESGLEDSQDSHQGDADATSPFLGDT